MTLYGLAIDEDMARTAEDIMIDFERIGEMDGVVEYTFRSEQERDAAVFELKSALPFEDIKTFEMEA